MKSKWTKPDISIIAAMDDIAYNQIKLNESSNIEDWSVEKKSRLIELILLEFPLPSFYMGLRFERSDFIWDVISGNKRLLVFKQFIDDDFRLTGLSMLPEHENKLFSDLSGLDVARISTYKLDVNLIECSAYNVYKILKASLKH